MNTFVSVNTYTYSVTYVTDKLLLSLKEVIRESGLSPAKVAEDWEVLHRGISTWLSTRHLETVVLEVYDPSTKNLVGRWDFDIIYDTSGDGDMWVDTEDIKYHILKSGRWPEDCDYRIVTTTERGRPDVSGWSKTTLRSTDGFIRQSIGTTIDGSGLRASAGYWRRS